MVASIHVTYTSKTDKHVGLPRLTQSFLAFVLVAVTCSFVQGQDTKIADDSGKSESLIALGTNNNAQISESSGLARSTYVEDAVWTLNDSGHPTKLFLMKHDGRLLAEIMIAKSVNRDWEALTRFSANDRNYLLIADVGDNLRRTKVYDLYWLEEPDFSKELHPTKVVRASVPATKIQFTYPEGSKNCEAVAVDESSKQIWLVEKVYFDSKQKKPPGIYVLPLELTPTAKPHVARRIADFPVRNVTGMAFSADGKRLLIRNYLTAHLYSREAGETWAEVVRNFKPVTVVLPLQRQAEAVCFTKDSNAVILTSELRGQQIWQVGLQSYFAKPRRKKTTKTNPKTNDK